MKKSLIALSVLAATASVAQAQNVTLYGSLDGSVANVKSGSFSNTVLLSGTHTSPRLGFRGTEDLGGGLRAHFGLEAGITLDTGVLGGASGATGANSTGASQIFSRGAFVGVQGAMGTVNLGKISTHPNAFLFNYLAGGNYNIVSFRNATTGLTGWRDNTLEYITPTVSGFTGRVLHTFGNTASSSTGSEGTTDANKNFGKGQEFSIAYASGPLMAGYYQSKVSQTGSDVKESSSSLAANYNFGFARVGAAYLKYDPSDAATSNQRKGTALSVSYPVTSAVTLVGFTGSVTQEAATAAAEIKTRYSSLGADLALSKRTTAYLVYLKASNNANGQNSLGGLGATGTTPSSNTITALNGSPLPTITAGDDPEMVGIGIRHSF